MYAYLEVNAMKSMGIPINYSKDRASYMDTMQLKNRQGFDT